MTNFEFTTAASSTPQPKAGILGNLKSNIVQSGVNAALHNSGVMRHGLNANYYAHHGRPIMAVREGASAVWDAVTGSRK